MPIQACEVDEGPGIRWGEHGKCYGYKAGDEASKEAARKKALKQMGAIKWSQSQSKEQIIKELKADLATGDPTLNKDINVDKLINEFGSTHEDFTFLLQAGLEISKNNGNCCGQK